MNHLSPSSCRANKHLNRRLLPLSDERDLRAFFSHRLDRSSNTPKLKVKQQLHSLTRPRLNLPSFSHRRNSARNVVEGRYCLHIWLGYRLNRTPGRVMRDIGRSRGTYTEGRLSILEWRLYR